MNNVNIKAKEIIYAGAIGDAFGYLIEFDSWEKIQQKYGVNGLQYHIFKNLYYRVSDDTQMTLFCWNAILNKLEEKKLKIVPIAGHHVSVEPVNSKKPIASGPQLTLFVTGFIILMGLRHYFSIQKSINKR